MSSASSQPPVEKTGGSTSRPYTDEFRRDVVRLITDEGYSIPAARACGVCDQTIRNWHGKLAPQNCSAGEGASVEELKAEVKRLRKELKKAEMERAILENTTARRRRFHCPAGAFAKESL